MVSDSEADEPAGSNASIVGDEAAVLELYRLGRITSGAGARLLGIGRVDFLELAGSRGIPTIQITPEELDAEVEAIRRHRDG